MGSPPNWKALFAAAASKELLTLDERIELAKPVIAAVDGALDGLLSTPNSSNKVYKALDIAYLNTTVQSLDGGKQESYRTLVALNDVLTAATPRFAWCLVEHSFLTALVRLHQRVAKMDDPVAQAAVLVLCSITLLAGHAAGDNLEAVASRPEVCELVISQLIYLAVTPAVLLTARGLGTAARCIQMCWELTRHPTPHCKGFRELLQRTDLAARLLVIATVAASGSPTAAAGAAEAASGGEAATASAAALVSAMASLEAGSGKAAAGANPGGEASAGSAADDLFEERLALAAQATSLVANLAGLGTRGLELSAAGLAPQRAWLLRPGTLGLLRPVLDGLADGLGELRRRMESSGSGSGSGSESRSGGEAERQEQEKARLQALGPYGDLRPSTVSRRRLLDQAEGAVRNLLFLLGLPTVVMGSSEEDVVEACGFVIRHAFGMFTEGYVDTMRALRAAVAEPSASAASASVRGAAFTSPYPGDYADFFRAFAGHVETVAPALGVQLEDWGVRFTGEQAARDLPTMQVGEGVDARIAQSWLKGQIQEIINWGHSVLNLVRMADLAKMSPQQRQQVQQQLQQQQAQQQGFPAVAAPHAYGGGAASGGNSCASCGTVPPAGNPPFQHCGKCRTVRYCSRACQLAHWPQHKPVCKPAAQATAPAGAAAGASSVAPTPATAH